MDAHERRPRSVQVVRGDAADKWCAEERLARDGMTCHSNTGPSRVTAGCISSRARDRPRSHRPVCARRKICGRRDRRSAAWRAIQCVRHPVHYGRRRKREDCLGPAPAGSQEGTYRGRAPGQEARTLALDVNGMRPGAQWLAQSGRCWIRQTATRSLSRCRAMTIRWISDVPSPISPIFASRIIRSTGYSLV